MHQNRTLIIAPIAALLAALLFSLILIPSINPSPKEMPVAIVNLDAGIDVPDVGKMNMGNTIVENISKAMSADPLKTPVVKFITVSSEDEVKAGMNDKEYYAAIIIPSDFSMKQASFQTPSPVSPELTIYINQGMNQTAATLLTTVLNGMVDGINTQIRTQFFAEIEKNGATLSVAQATVMVNPIARNVVTVNEVGANSAGGNAPMSLFQPIWMACIVAVIMLQMYFSKLTLHNKKERTLALLTRAGVGIATAFIVGFGFTWMVSNVIGLNIPNFTATALILTFAYCCFFFMMSAVLSWLGQPGMLIFVLLLFFGAPLLALPQEFMPSFYRDFVNPWLPMRFMISTVRDSLYFGKGFYWSKEMLTLLWIGLGGLVIMFTSVFKKSSVKES